MGRLKRKVQKTKWEKSTKAIGISLTLIQMTNMYTPMISQASAAIESTTESNAESDQNTSVNNDVYGESDTSKLAIQTMQANSYSDMYMVDYAPRYSGLMTLEPVLQMEFSKNIKLGQGSIQIYRTDNDQLVENISISGSYMEGATYSFIDQHTIRVTTKQELADSLEYYIKVAPGTFEDTDGNDFSGISSPYAWVMRTPDFTAPTAKMITDYGNDHTDVSKLRLGLQFSERVRLNYGQIHIYRSSDDMEVGRLSSINGSLSGFNISGYSVHSGTGFEFKLSSGLSSEAYYINVDSGLFSDGVGNPYVGIHGTSQWNFSIAEQDWESPYLVNYSPQKQIDTLKPYMSMQFNENVKFGHGTIGIYRSNDDYVVQEFQVHSGVTYNGQLMISGALVQLPVPSNLEENTHYYVKVDPYAIYDLADNPSSGYAIFHPKEAWTFTTPNIHPLEVNHYEYQDGPTTHLMMQFSKYMQLKKGHITIHRQWDGMQIASLSQSSGYILSGYGATASMSGGSIDIAFVDGEESESYFVLIDSGVFVDMIGQPYGGIHNDTDWNFRIAGEDQRAPYLTRIWPEVGQTVATLQPRVNLEFNEPVQFGNGSISIYRSSDHQLVEKIQVLSGFTSNEEHSWSGIAMGFELPKALEENTEYYVNIEKGTVVDRSGNDFSGLTSDNWWTFKTPDVTAPTAKTITDYRDDNTVLSNLRLSLQFSERVRLKDGYIHVYRASDNQEVFRLSSIDGLLSGFNISGYFIHSGTGFEFMMMGPYTSDSYYINVDSGMFVDEVGHPYAGIHGTSQWNFSIAEQDWESPYLVNYSPQKQIDTLKPYMSMQFNENVKFGHGTIGIYRSINDSLVEEFQVNSGTTHNGQLMISGALVQLPMLSNLEENTHYYVKVDPYAIYDLADNRSSGYAIFHPKEAWTFTTPDIHPLEANYYEYQDGPTTHLMMQFSEPVQLKKGHITIHRQWDGTQIASLSQSSGYILSGYGATASMSGGSIDIAFVDGEESESYFVMVDSGVFVDMIGQPYSGIHNDTDWNFTIAGEDQRAPYLTRVEPRTGQMMETLKPRLHLDFNERVQFGNGSLSIYRSDDHQLVEKIQVLSGFTSTEEHFWSGIVMSFEIPEALEENTEYYVNIEEGTVVDRSGNRFSGLVSDNGWTFKTPDLTAPTAKTITDYHDGNNELINPSLRLEFSERVHMNYGQIHIYRASDNVEVGRLSSVDGVLSGFNISGYSIYSGAGFEFKFQDAESGELYYINIDSGLFVDEVGHPYAGIYGDSHWNFSIADYEAPYMIRIDPRIEVDQLDPKLNIEFNEFIKYGNGSISIYRSNDDQLIEKIPVLSGSTSSDSFFHSGSVVSFALANPLNEYTKYYVQINKGTFVDVAGNPFEGLDDKNSWNFMVHSPISPDLISSGYGSIAGSTIRNLPNNLTVGKFLANLRYTFNAEGEVLTTSGTVLNEERIITSGMKLNIWSHSSETKKIYSLEVGKPTSSKSDSDKKTGNNQPSTPVSFAPVNPESSPTSVPTATGGSGGAQPQATPTNSSTNGTPSVPAKTNPSAGNTVPVLTSSPNVLVIVAPVQATADTVSLPANNPSTNALVYYYDNNWDKWIAVPTTRDNTDLKATVPQGAWTSVIANSNIAQPQDTINSWANKDILKLMSLDIVQGDATGSYNPQQAVNRYEMAVMLAKVLRLDIPTVSTASVTTDNNAMPAWAEPYVRAVSEQGIMVGDNNGFNGTRSITREQLATMIGRMLPESTISSTPSVTYKDAKKVSSWATQGIEKVNALGLMSGYPDQTFRPNQEVTREEMAAVLSKLVDILK
ncbi:Ig-like domain-containing protein [Paenibacillus kyungheensis]|uniref:Ig-like domain-containing protein n=1 Tax=Paenibacillus kyungheensis TaxID=1452732 RepID=A0AAX3M4N2_9BACL|nr:Ig-like domain-containing protein [Paenibacillus kyungheensis]WCT56842.1 Ig-like domain-containing protein [Paenibacillus kyungheensis]